MHLCVTTARFRSVLFFSIFRDPLIVPVYDDDETQSKGFEPQISLVTENRNNRIYSIFKALENASITVKVPEKHWAYQGQQVSLPLTSSLWACSEPEEKNSQQGMLDPAFNLALPLKVCVTILP